MNFKRHYSLVLAKGNNIFLRLRKKKKEEKNYNGQPSGRRIRRVTTTFWCLSTVCRSLIEPVFHTLMIVTLYGTAP